MKIVNFYEAAYLLSQNHFISELMRDENGKRVYYFNENEDEIKNNIIEFRENKTIQNYINGIVLLRRLNNNFLKKENLEKVD